MPSRHKNLSIFVPHEGCPHRCSFCDQNAISGTDERPTPEEVRRLCDRFLPASPEEGADYEIAFFGGSFTAIERDYMIRLLEAAGPFVESGRASGIRCSTRPDAVDEEILDIYRRYGGTSIELGAQSMNDTVLTLNRRGHTCRDVYRAARLIKEAGFSLGLQMMTGLYGREPYRVDAMATAEAFARMGPDTVRIYPTLTLKNTLLARLYERGAYVPPALEESVDLCAQLVPFFEERDIRVIKLGLHADRSLEESLVAGPYHPAFRELVESRILYSDVLARLERLGAGRYTVSVSPKEVSRMTGQSKENVRKLAERGFTVKVRPDSSLSGRNMEITGGIPSVFKGN